MNAEHLLKETSRSCCVAAARACSRCRAASRLSCAGSSSSSLRDGRALVRACDPRWASLRERTLDPCERELREELASPPMREGRPSKALRPPRATRPLWLTDPSREDEAAREVREERMLDLS